MTVPCLVGSSNVRTIYQAFASVSLGEVTARAVSTIDRPNVAADQEDGCVCVVHISRR